jgi:hypothetical protein
MHEGRHISKLSACQAAEVDLRMEERMNWRFSVLSGKYGGNLALMPDVSPSLCELES